MNVLTFDIEEWFIEKHFQGNRSERYQAFDRYLKSILELLDECNFQATFFCVDDFHKYKDVESLKEALLEQWKTFWREKNITDECRDCQFFQPGYCYGLCSAKRKVM